MRNILSIIQILF